ncbi:TetR-like C-terminal domain-containing protein [Kitasatospora sp. NPDC127121]|uniref:TetR-like C-terminal domain-containing protein n=1 Tax=unclassified Kitasatospora TaxID=2633591 RepID=UPI00363C0618
MQADDSGHQAQADADAAGGRRTGGGDRRPVQQADGLVHGDVGAARVRSRSVARGLHRRCQRITALLVWGRGARHETGGVPTRQCCCHKSWRAGEREQGLEAVLGRERARGEQPPTLEHTADAVLAPLYYRAVFTDLPLTAEWTRTLVSRLLSPGPVQQQAS